MDRRLVAMPLALALTLGCAHSGEQWRAELARRQQLESESAAKDRELAAAKQRIAALEAELGRLGYASKQMQTSLAEQERRVKQLEQLKARFELLRRKLAQLTDVGLSVTFRKNRMVISLPGDVLFDTGKDTLRRDGQEILKQVAAVIRHDKSLLARDYQVAGHTDNLPLQGGPFHDNWGLSLMRARAVLLHLIGKGGGLPRNRWSAAGFADTDPVAGNATAEGRQKNRRCELIVVPDADEIVHLESIADPRPPR